MTSSLRQRWSSLPGVAKVAVLASILALVLLVLSLYPVLLALFIPAAKSSITKSENEDRAKQALQAFIDYQRQFDGRSLFFTPAPLASSEPEPEPAPDEGSKEPPKPSSYAGPSIIAMINDAVWFDNGKRLKVGEEKQDDLKVVKMSPPWEATIEWKGVEFAVNLFSRDSVVLNKSASSPAPSSPPEQSNPEPKPEAHPEPKPPAPTPPPTTSPESTPQTTPPAHPPQDTTTPPPTPPGDHTPSPPDTPQPQLEPATPEPAPSETPKDPNR